MHHYPRHIGDYQKDTKGLSLAEHGAYSQLMDEYYAHERPLPEEHARLYRICGATTEAEQSAVDIVVGRYFEKTDSGYTHRRCDAEIAKYKSKSVNGSLGGRGNKSKANLKLTEKLNESEPESEPESETKANAEATKNQEPRTNNQPTVPVGGVGGGRAVGREWIKPNLAALQHTPTLMAWFDSEAKKAGIADPADENRLWALAAAERSLAVGKNKPNLFFSLINELAEHGPDGKLREFLKPAQKRFAEWKGKVSA